jgi:hypothetical protein
MQLVSENKLIQFPPKSTFDKLIANEKYSVSLYQYSPEHLKNQSYITLDGLNPRLQNDYNAISNADLDHQIIKFGQIFDAIGRYVKDSKGQLQFNENGLPLIAILDGSRRFDCCVRNNQAFSIIVGDFDDITSEIIIKSSFDSQQDLSCLELGLVINQLESKSARTLKLKEIEELLDYKKSRDAISYAKKSMRIYDNYPGIFNIFPVINLVGKNTISKLEKIIQFAEENFSIDILLKFIKGELFDYGQENALLSNEDLINLDSQTNAIILEALIERIGYKEKKKTNLVISNVNDYTTMQLKANMKKVCRTPHITMFEAELTDEERLITERFFNLLVSDKSKDNQDIPMSDKFEYFFRQFD